MPTYTLVAGIDGVGKSSFAGVLKSERNDLGRMIDVDKIAVENKCSALDAGKIALANQANTGRNGSRSWRHA